MRQARARLASARVGLWVLTGDKKETAIEIAKSCALITPAMDVHDLSAADEPAPVAAPSDAKPEDGAPAPPASSPAAKPLPLVLGVRMFLHGSQQHLAAYDLSRLSEVTDTGASGAPGTLAQIVDCYRPSPFYVGGLDAVGAPARDAFASTRTRA